MDRATFPLHSALVFCAISVAVYLSAFRGEFYYDDSLTILDNPHLFD